MKGLCEKRGGDMELVYKKSECKTYKDFYEKICKDLKLEDDIDLCDYKNLEYNADLLNEFMWGFYNDNIMFKFIGFDRDSVKNSKRFDDYQWNLIFDVLEWFVEKFPNNSVVFLDEE